MARRYERTASVSVPALPDGGYGSIADALNRFSSRVDSAVDPYLSDRSANRIRETVATGGEITPSIGLTLLQRQRNEVAQTAFVDRVTLDLRAKQAELHQEFNGDRLSDPDEFAKRLDAYAQPKLAAVPEQFRGRAIQQFENFRNESVTRLQEAAFENEDRRNLADMKAADAADVDHLNAAMRDGDAQAASDAGERLAARRQRMIDAGLMGPEVANYEAAKIAGGALAQHVFGQVFRGEVDGAATVADLMRGGRSAQGLSLQQRDALVADITTEMGRQHAEAARAGAAADALAKEDREGIQTQLWANIFSGDASKRPTPKMIVDAQAANILSPSEAEQMLRTLATEKVARTDTGTVARLEDEFASGVDVSEHATDAARNGLIPWELAGDFRSRSQARKSGGSNLVDERRRDVVTLFTDSGPYSNTFPEDEKARKIDALRYFDDKVHSAKEGRDPDTGYTFAELEADKALVLLQQRRGIETSKRLRAVPPRNAVTVPGPNPLDPPKLDVAATVGPLLLENKVGLLSDAELDAELELIDRWKAAGMVK